MKQSGHESHSRVFQRMQCGMILLHEASKWTSRWIGHIVYEINHGTATRHMTTTNLKRMHYVLLRLHRDMESSLRSFLGWRWPA